MEKDTLWKFVKDLWDNAENKSDLVKQCKNYWEGNLNNAISTSFYFPDQKRTNFNVIKPIIETKLKNMLDAQFSIAVVSDTGSFFDMAAIKDSERMADIFNDEIHNIFDRNNLDGVQEEVARLGELAGFGCSQTDWNNDSRPDGDIEIKFIDSGKVRWNKGAKSVKDSTYIGYELELPPYKAKYIYARDSSGNFDIELCKKIDEVVEIEQDKSNRKQSGAVVNYQNTSNNTAGRAFAESGVEGLQADKKVKLIVLYLLDDSVYAPEEKDSNELEVEKQDYIRAFPSGRVIVFNANDSKKLVLKDEPMSDNFKNLGNLDVFNSTRYNDLAGKGEVEDLIPIQDRINGLSFKYREKVVNDFDTIFVDADSGFGDSSVVRGAITKVTDLRDKALSVTSNDGIVKAGQILEMIDQLKKQAYEIARVNETMLYGSRQTGTTSGEQVEMLQESPMADIRAQQRNFKDWIIGVAEKCLFYIVKNYTHQRLIKLSTGQADAKFARIDTNMQGDRNIELLNEAMQIVETIKFNDDWKFKVKASAGTEIPRSRKESAALIDKIMASPIMQQQDLDLTELYFKIQDVPNSRAIISMLRKKQEEQAKQPPPKLTLIDLIKSPEQGKTASDLFKALTGYSKAQGQMLTMIGLEPSTDTITTAPAQQITAKSAVKDIAVVAPQQLSENPDQVIFGHNAAKQIESRAFESKREMKII